MKLLFLNLLFVLASSQDVFFNRIATFNVCTQWEPTCNIDTETVAEIVDASPDGNTLVYTDGATEGIGFIDITDPTMPMPGGVVDVGGETTSVAVTKDGRFVVAAVNNSPNFTSPTGSLVVIDIMGDRPIVATLELPGQPDSIDVSPDDAYIAIAIENERNEELGDGRPPQLPAGSLVVVDKSDMDPNNWSLQEVVLTGLTGILFPEDPEPEYVDIGEDNVAVVTLQENNGIVMVNLTVPEVIASFSAGNVAELTQIDVEEEKAKISQTGNLTDIPREPDAVVWLSTEYFATADEGDLDGGSRGFTIFARDGTVVYESGNMLEHMAVRFGHYPDGRSENKGNEPEGITFATFGSESMLFLLSERSNIVFVFSVDPADPSTTTFKQVLPAGVGPEGVRAIPSRNLLAVASEVDERGSKMRSSISLYSYEFTSPNYPTLVSADRADGTPIPFSALSGLASPDAPGMPTSTSRRLAGHTASHTLYSVEDSFYKSNRIFTIDVENFPYTVTAEMEILDSNDILFAIAPDVVNDDKTINVDPEGIAVSHKGGFWVCHEGAGTVGDAERPLASPNVILKVTEAGVIEKVIGLPDEVNAIQLRFGFEGIAEEDNMLVVAFQRAWGDEANPRLGIYDTVAETWKFVFYPLDAPESQNGGWVGLGDIAPLGEGQFVVIERDNQGGPDAAIKRLYKIDLGDFSMEEGTTIEKTFVSDLIPRLRMPKGNVYEKIEGLAIEKSGEMWIVNDNDGVEDNSGEQQLIEAGVIDIPSPPGTSSASVPQTMMVLAMAVFITLM